MFLLLQDKPSVVETFLQTNTALCGWILNSQTMKKHVKLCGFMFLIL